MQDVTRDNADAAARRVAAATLALEQALVVAPSESRLHLQEASTHLAIAGARLAAIQRLYEDENAQLSAGPRSAGTQSGQAWK